MVTLDYQSHFTYSTKQFFNKGSKHESHTGS